MNVQPCDARLFTDKFLKLVQEALGWLMRPKLYLHLFMYLCAVHVYHKRFTCTVEPLGVSVEPEAMISVYQETMQSKCALTGTSHVFVTY